MFNLTFDMAVSEMRKGSFVALFSFDSSQSLHMWNGRVYTEEGYLIADNLYKELHPTGYKVIAPPEEVNFQLLQNFHDLYEYKEGIADSSIGNYQLCIKGNEAIGDVMERINEAKSLMLSKSESEEGFLSSYCKEMSSVGKEIAKDFKKDMNKDDPHGLTYAIIGFIILIILSVLFGI